VVAFLDSPVGDRPLAARAAAVAFLDSPVGGRLTGPWRLVRRRPNAATPMQPLAATLISVQSSLISGTLVFVSPFFFKTL
jgi:hypothetical protein